MKRSRSLVVVALLGLTLTLSFQNSARAQFTYTYFANDSTIDYAVGTDFAIVGFSGGAFDENFNPNFTGPSSPSIEVVDGADVEAAMVLFNHSTVDASGGYIGFISPADDSRVNLSGSDSVFVLSTDRAVINMTGGSVADLEGQGRLINVRGGTVGTLVARSEE